MRILGIDSAAPDPEPVEHPRRTEALLEIAASLGHDTALFIGKGSAGLSRILPGRSGVRIIAGSALVDAIAEPFHLVILTGEAVATRYLRDVRALVPGATVVFHAPELAFVQAGRQNRFKGQGIARLRALDLREREVSIARACDMTWTSSRADERWLTGVAPGLRVEVVPPVCDACPAEPSFQARKGLLMVGDPGDPARRDAEAFFRAEVLPLLRCRDRADHVVLHVDSVRDRSPAALSQLWARLASARVLVAPLRFSSGVPIEIVCAMARGVPVVTTTVGAEGLDAGEDDSVLVADTAEGLAERVAAVFTQPLLWERLVKSGQEAVVRWFSSGAGRERLTRILLPLAPSPMFSPRAPRMLEHPGGHLAPPREVDLGETTAGALVQPAHASDGRALSTAMAVDAGMSWTIAPCLSCSPACLASVVVCTHNGAKVIGKTVESLVRQNLPPEDFEIVVVDNASTDGSLDVIRGLAGRYPGRIRVVQEPVLGHSRARNRGVLETRGDVIAFTDDDAQAGPGWLRALVEACQQPRVGCAGGPVRAVAGGPLPDWLTPPYRAYLALFDRGRQERQLSYNEYPRGVNMAFPRQSFREVGLFSTAFGLKGRSLLYYDEIELCYRLERRGWRILYAPNAVVNHAIHPERLTPAWFRQRFYSQGKTEAYFDLVHCGRRRVAERLIRSGRLALTEAVCSGPASRAIDLSRLCRIWVSLGYGAGAVQGWMTGVSRRARPAPYDGPNLAHRARGSVAVPSPPLKASIVIPSKNGGELFALALERIFAQQTPWPFEVIVVDSGSNPESLEIARRFPVRLHAIQPGEFDHGRTRDLGASLAAGEHLVFVNQDAVPCTDDWLVRLLDPLLAGPEYAAVQGGIREFPDRPRFFWDSCGARFYFTRESERWIPRYGGIGFSTVNAAIRRAAWEACGFGQAVIMEDKKWQREASARGARIAYRADAAVYHTHNYDLRQLIKRCQQEGFGWKLVGENYSFADLLQDTLSAAKYRELWQGLRERRVRTWAEVLFPFMRPWLVFRGNRLLRKYPG